VDLLLHVIAELPCIMCCWHCRCDLWPPTTTGLTGHAPALTALLALLLQSKVEESRAFQNSTILAPRYLSASPYKGPKRKSKGSMDQY
jgi:hypothetical protein